MEKSSSTSKVLEVTVISAEGLLITRHQPVKKNAFVVVKSDPFNSRTTGMDTENGNYPKWNEKLVLELPVHVRFITVEAHAGSKFVGSAQIPVSDFGYLPNNYLNFLSYRLRDAKGLKNGIVNISVMVRGTHGGDTGSAVSSLRPSMGVPVNGGAGFGHGVVTGVPVYSQFKL